MKWHCRFRVLGLTLVLLAGVSCSASDGALTGVPDSQPPEQSSAVLGNVLGDFNGVVDDLGNTIDNTVDGLGNTIDNTVDGLGNTIDNTVDGLASGDLGGALGGAIGGILEITDLLTCSEQKYVSVTKTVDSKGGTIKVGEHVLVIPKGALSRKVKIKAEQMRGSTNSLRFSPAGLHFREPAALTMSYENCLVVLLPKRIVYTTEKFKILEVLRSLDLFHKKRVTAPIDHFSRYAVAY